MLSRRTLLACLLGLSAIPTIVDVVPMTDGAVMVVLENEELWIVSEKGWERI